MQNNIPPGAVLTGGKSKKTRTKKANSKAKRRSKTRRH
uniref:Uncharacterized protein n=1 Tax=viral metagenome TaxID=1070528 RepID=A0A6C0AMR8_9ZZZZ